MCQMAWSDCMRTTMENMPVPLGTNEDEMLEANASDTNEDWVGL